MNKYKAKPFFPRWGNPIRDCSIKCNIWDSSLVVAGLPDEDSDNSKSAMKNPYSGKSSENISHNRPRKWPYFGMMTADMALISIKSPTSRKFVFQKGTFSAGS